MKEDLDILEKQIKKIIRRNIIVIFANRSNQQIYY